MAKIVAIPPRAPGAYARRAAPSSEAAPRPKGLAPCLFYLFVEFARPMVWVPPLALIRPGMIAALWGVFAVIRTKARPIPATQWLTFALAAEMAWHVPWAMNHVWALRGFMDFTVLAAGCVLPLAVLPANLAAVRYLMTAYVLLHLPMALHGLVFHGRGLSGWMADENDLALALNIAMGIGFFLLLETRNTTKKVVLLGSIAIMLAANVSTISRGGFVGMASLAAYLLLTAPRRGLIALCVILAVFGLFLFAPHEYWDEVRSIRTSTQQGDTGEQRLYLWGMAWRMYLDHPIVGVGTRNFGIQAPYYEDFERSELGGYHVWGRVAHSLYFTLLSEQGSVGCLLFFGLVAWCVRAKWRLGRVARAHPEDPEARSASLLASGLLAGMFALLATGAFITVLYYPLFWVLAGLMGSLEGVARQRTAVRA